MRKSLALIGLIIFSSSILKANEPPGAYCSSKGYFAFWHERSDYKHFHVVSFSEVKGISVPIKYDLPAEYPFNVVELLCEEKVVKIFFSQVAFNSKQKPQSMKVNTQFKEMDVDVSNVASPQVLPPKEIDKRKFSKPPSFDLKPNLEPIRLASPDGSGRFEVQYASKEKGIEQLNLVRVNLAGSIIDQQNLIEYVPESER